MPLDVATLPRRTGTGTHARSRRTRMASGANALGRWRRDVCACVRRRRGSGRRSICGAASRALTADRRSTHRSLVSGERADRRARAFAQPNARQSVRRLRARARVPRRRRSCGRAVVRAAARFDPRSRASSRHVTQMSVVAPTGVDEPDKRSDPCPPTPHPLRLFRAEQLPS
jgi:hypothetical protein